MGKRSDFERVGHDFYATWDKRALVPLRPHLQSNTRFIEPCAGAGDLVAQLEREGHICLDKYDLHPGDSSVRVEDALSFKPDLVDGAHFITNPPWTRPILHKLIVALSDIAPTWLLIDSNWANTTQKQIAATHGVPTVPQLMRRCAKIVVIGRLIWIPGTTMAGKDDVSWFLFDKNNTQRTQFFPKEL